MPLLKTAGICLVTGVQLLCQVMSDLPMTSEEGQTKVKNDQVYHH